jgi:hypothetical protein
LLAISLGVGLAAGLVLAYLLTSPGAAPTTAATAPSASVTPAPPEPPPPAFEADPPRAVAVPRAVDAAPGGRAEAEPDELSMPERRGTRGSSPLRTVPGEKKGREKSAPAAPRAPAPTAPTAPPQDDPLAP